ncbi:MULTISPECIES: HIT family protein [Sphingobacterium]|uniref:HIT family protein n=1 Tax=Sphingobacterium paramultivorum TaxID=2886510 RepID=A0A7G5E3L3_9SPHI|nr:MULTISPECIES: HIT family protein [Sphingobacterium]MBB1645719.1 HIT family hydrolase [Sphingobacterium sp. UME9]MCS4167831.1 histidine triad (HIT) family protein [Sphingobacterium sp. BIGb0116]QMV68588.1 HIT family protein [Sphingobacterium paramultivorum]WET69545.1 MAG: HIT family protein [Sphingobacterium sp.]WSO17531.1 HIT family protein [Sphingobacterium paramultivorum]
MSTIFSKIVAGEIPAYKVAESNDFLAFLDISPLAKGHVLVIPKKETDYIFDIEDDEYMALWVFAKIVAQGIKKVIPCVKVGVAVVGLEVAHAHIHLVPINKISDLNFAGPKLSLAEDELHEIATTIRESIVGITAQNQ